MIKFILIAGVWVNVNNIISLEPKGKDLSSCNVFMATGSGGWFSTTNEPCEEIIREIEKLEARK